MKFWAYTKPCMENFLLKFLRKYTPKCCVYRSSIVFDLRNFGSGLQTKTVCDLSLPPPPVQLFYKPFYGIQIIYVRNFWTCTQTEWVGSFELTVLRLPEIAQKQSFLLVYPLPINIHKVLLTMHPPAHIVRLIEHLYFASTIALSRRSTEGLELDRTPFSAPTILPSEILQTPLLSS